MSTQTFSGYSNKKSSSRVLQRPGGKQSINLFGGGDTTPQKQHQRRGSRTGNLSGNSPFGAQGGQQQQQQRNSRQVPANNPTYTPNNNSPFSKAPMPQKKVNPRVTAVSSNSPFGGDGNTPVKVRRSSSVNNTSQHSPFNPQGAAPKAVQQRQYKANQPSNASPFNPQGAAPQQPRRSSSQRFQNSQGNPLAQSQQPQGVRQSKSSVRLHQTPGGTQSVNLFGGAQQPQRQTRQTPTYQSSAQAPWNPNGEDAPEIQRKDIKANAMSAHNPLAPGYEPANPQELRQQQVRRQPKANVPDKNSPFSKQTPAPMKRRNSKNFHTSSSNPLSARQGGAPKARNNAIKIQQTPGGRQSVNLFGSNNYA